MLLKVFIVLKLWYNNNMTENFSNDIADLPPIGVGKKYDISKKEMPDEVRAKLDLSKEAKEAAFRRWLVKNKPKAAVMTPIETSTAVGVPDIFCVYNGQASWLECKINATYLPPRIRGTQYSYLKKLIEAGGKAKIVVQQFNPNTAKATSITIYDASHIVTIPSGMFRHIGEELMFPCEIEPFYRWHYKQKGDKKELLENLYMRLLLDTSEFI